MRPLSARRLRVLIQALPIDSMYAVASGAHIRGWGTTEELLALVAELVDGTQRTVFAAHSKKGTPVPKPLRIDRPHHRKKRRPATSADLVEMFGGVARYTGP